MEISRAPFDMDDKCLPLRKPRSRLSVNAPEYKPIVNGSSVQSRLTRYQNPNEHAAAASSSSSTPSCSSALNQNIPPSDLNSNNVQPTDVEKIALDYLTAVIQCLNEKPGSFDTVATRFLTIFEGLETNEYVLSIAMEDIFNESIENSNFRYMGAKLYHLLHTLDPREDSLFHTLLKCKLDFHQAEVIEFMENKTEQKVRETALFLAELYMQLRDDTRINLIVENIIFSLKQLLTKSTTDNIRCICLTLKLVGYDLDCLCPTDVSMIMQQLEAANKASPLVQNVISLKKNNWGRTAASDHPTVSRSSSESNYQAAFEPTLYGPDGNIITREENQFLSTCSTNATPSNDDDEEFDLDVDLDPEMDEDTEKDYIKFCKLNK